MPVWGFNPVLRSFLACFLLFLFVHYSYFSKVGECLIFSASAAVAWSMYEWVGWGVGGGGRYAFSPNFSTVWHKCRLLMSQNSQNMLSPNLIADYISIWLCVYLSQVTFSREVLRQFLLWKRMPAPVLYQVDSPRGGFVFLCLCCGYQFASPGLFSVMK